MASLTNNPLGNWLAPALSTLLLVVTAALGLVGVEGGQTADAFHDRVRAVMEATPYKIDRWVGSDVEAAAAATRLLRPVKLMQRRYTDPATGRSFNLLMVYCGDTRDMLGHYPPNCYPAHGWKIRGDTPATFRLEGQSFPATEYSFTRSVVGVDQNLGVFNFFALPSGTDRLVATMDSVNRASQTRSGAQLGAAQIQILFDDSFTPAERAEVRESVLSALTPVIETITAGADDDE